jgi:lipopolysaccharide transport system ATP-binding protein
MYVRLAFAVAAHLEPEILVVDEVLAVGDTAFQSKCLGKMQDVSAQGRTVLFVSHYMVAIRRLCSRAVLLENGRVAYDGDAGATIERYLANGAPSQRSVSWDDSTAPRSNEIALRAVRVKGGDGGITTPLSTGEPITIEIEYTLAVPVYGLRIHIKLSSGEHVEVFSSSDYGAWHDSKSRPSGDYVSRCTIPADLLNTGSYILMVGADIPAKRAVLDDMDCLSFEILELRYNPMGLLYSGRPRGVINPVLDWEIRPPDLTEEVD